MWQDLPDKKACRIVIDRSGANLDDQEQWPDFYGWLLERSERFKATFAPRLQSMDLPDPEEATVVAPAAAAERPNRQCWPSSATDAEPRHEENLEALRVKSRRQALPR